jgi:hypothetical protein
MISSYTVCDDTAFAPQPIDSVAMRGIDLAIVITAVIGIVLFIPAVLLHSSLFMEISLVPFAVAAATMVGLAAIGSD